MSFLNRMQKESRSIEEILNHKIEIGKEMEQTEDFSEFDEAEIKDYPEYSAVEENTSCEENNSPNQQSKNTPNKPETTEEITNNDLNCFGWKDIETEKWLGKFVKFWFYCMSFAWFIFGALTFAPIIFIRNKVNVIFKDKKKSLFCAVVIHVVLSTLIVIFFVA